MSWGNCFIHAVSRWIKLGGWLLIRRSPFRRFILHFVHAIELPKDLPVSQFIPIDPFDKSNFVVWYKGKTVDTIGEVNPPDSGGFDWVLLGFWASYFVGYIAIVAWIIYWIWS